MPSIGQPLPHDSARGHVTGQAAFIDDAPRLPNELLLDTLASPIAKGTIESLDLTAARTIPGVHALYTHQDIPGSNHIGPIVHDEELLASRELLYIGHPVVLIAADSLEAIAAAKKSIHLKIREAQPVLTIEDAIAQQSFIAPTRTIARGDVDAALKSSPHTLTGSLTIGGQDHFYLESHACQTLPNEDGAVTVHSSTQNPTEVQATVAHVLGIGMHQVICTCKRMGGGFGGKETQAAGPAALAALVATRLKRPARFVYTKDDDMKFTGKRHPYLARYHVGFDHRGQLLALKVDFYSNAGFSTDLSLAVMERTMLHADNAYFIPHAHITGTACKTNLPSNTAFRGFGGPQGVACIEHVMESIASELDLDPMDVRKINLYDANHHDPHSDRRGLTCFSGSGKTPSPPARNLTPYGQLVENNLLPDIFDRLEKSSDYRNRRRAVNEFNATSKTHLKGLSLTPVKFGISFTKKHLNQGNALVNVYTDGTVQVSTGGTEMGQGLNTKIRQLVADEFAIPPDRVLVMTTSTEKNNNTSPTAASASTDLNGTAAVNAARAIKSRLADFAAHFLFHHPQEGRPASPTHVAFDSNQCYDQRNPNNRIDFPALCQRAHLERVDLGHRGFYATPGVDFNRDTGKGTPFLYYTTGAAIAEVTIDRFTGDLTIDRVDLTMDLGQMINPGIDKGQVVGGFVQGMGWCTTEQLVYGDKGALLSYSPTTYKIPNVQDVPKTFNVSFIPNPHNTRNIAASKAVGEPPLLLGLSCWTAAHNALSHLTTSPVDLDLPATNEQILLRLTQLTTPAQATARAAKVAKPIAAAAAATPTRTPIKATPDPA